ncbi:MAG: amidohydrolase, partial [Pannonibacter indicus]
MTLTTLRTAAPAAERDLFAATVPGFAELRRELHQEPELSGSEVRTSARIAALLKAWGYQVETGIGGHGVVGTLVSGSGSRKLGLRADFDALPIHEQTGLPYASRTEGVMHACGHDGHTAILLAAASWLARTRGFDGTLRLIFQPAEETASGARAMLSDGLLERFPIDAIYGLHNWPGLPDGQFGFITGPAMAAVDQVSLTVKGRGGHGAAPHEAIDPVVISAYALTALQSIVSRNVNPLESAVVTAGSIHGGSASNIIPDEVDLKLTLRSFTPQTRDLL